MNARHHLKAQLAQLVNVVEPFKEKIPLGVHAPLKFGRVVQGVVGDAQLIECRVHGRFLICAHLRSSYTNAPRRATVDGARQYLKAMVFRGNGI